jgi:glycosyltransferase involved in cell wall biosynthesis
VKNFWLRYSMDRKPVVTVGLCVKNAKQTIYQAIASILDQDFPRDLMEIIIVDGYSKDGTLKIIIGSLLKKGIQYKVFYENKGLGTARQIVVDNARGKYIVWVDGDMTLNKDYVRTQVEFMERNPKVGVAGGKFQMLQNLNFVATVENIEWLVWDFESQNKPVLEPTRHYCGGTIYRVQAIKEAGGFDLNIKGSGEDLDAEIRISEAGWFLYFITEALFHDNRKNTFQGIWDENFWYGYGSHYFLHKYTKRVPASSVLKGLKHSSIAYKLTHRKIAFLLLPQYVFKKIAWCFGFTKAHIDGYGHNSC